MSSPQCTRKIQPRPTDVRRDAAVPLPACSSIDLLNFPREIRNRIYESILTDPNVILSSCENGATSPRFHAASRRNKNVFDLNIFRVSKQVFLEAREVFFSRNTFDINIIEEQDTMRYNFVPTGWDYAIQALRHVKVCLHLRLRQPTIPRAPRQAMLLKNCSISSSARKTSAHSSCGSKRRAATLRDQTGVLMQSLRLSGVSPSYGGSS
jgi:hypothetical protein